MKDISPQNQETQQIPSSKIRNKNLDKLYETVICKNRLFLKRKTTDYFNNNEECQKTVECCHQCGKKKL